MPWGFERDFVIHRPALPVRSVRYAMLGQVAIT